MMIDVNRQEQYHKYSLDMKPAGEINTANTSSVIVL